MNDAARKLFEHSGFCFPSVQASEAGVHRPHVAGIHGRDSDGAYSIVLSGGYEDDLVSASIQRDILLYCNVIVCFIIGYEL